jgi:hypothetical protein
MLKQSVSVFALSALMAGSAALHAQTCGGTLSCTTNPAYTFTSSAAGGVLFGTNTNGGASPAVGVQGRETNIAVGSSGVAGFDGNGCTPASGSLGPAGVIGGSAAQTGVIGFTNSQGNGQAGVAGYYWDNQFFCGGSAAVSGYLGYKTGNNLYGVYSVGNFAATGTKAFLEPHPTDPSKEIRYVSLEGPEAGTYFRGSGHTVHGRAVIEVPESFRLVTAAAGLTVVVTPTGELAQVAAISKSLNKIVIQSSKDVAFDYVVNGVRKAFQDLQAIIPNSDFVPSGPDDRRFFALPAESQQRLIDTGIYLPDGKVNLDKAHEMGWDAQWKAQQDASRSTEGFLRFAGLTPQ